MKNRLFDFKVDRLPLKVKGIDTERDAIVRPDINKCLGIVSRDYRMVTHQEAVGTAEKALKDLGDFEVWMEKVTQDGGRIYMYYKSKKEYNLGYDKKLECDDILNPSFILNNSYDGTKQFGFEFGVYRLVCKNGLRVTQKIFVTLMKHTSGLDLNIARDNMTNVLGSFENETLPIWTKWSKRNVEVNPLLDRLVEKQYAGKRLVKGLKEKGDFAKAKTAWDVYNVFTKHYTHDYKESFDSSHILNQRIVDGMTALMK